MRRLLLAYTILSVPSAAFATSPDLIFCSKLPDKTERIHCYDAAARIAEARTNAPAATPTRIAAPTTQTASNVMAKAPAASALPAPRNPFAGSYATVGASYGVGSSRTTTIQPAILYPPTSGRVEPQGTSVVASAGYNIMFDRWLVGFEVDGRYGAEHDSWRATNVMLGNALNAVIFASHRYRYSNDGAVHVSLRGGATFENTLIYAKAGVGVARLREEWEVNDQVLLTNLTLPFVQNASKTTWVPSYLLGAGIEQNFAWAFARFAVEAEIINRQTTEGFDNGSSVGTAQGTKPFWTARATAQIGARF